MADDAPLNDDADALEGAFVAMFAGLRDLAVAEAEHPVIVAVGAASTAGWQQVVDETIVDPLGDLIVDQVIAESVRYGWPVNDIAVGQVVDRHLTEVRKWSDLSSRRMRTWVGDAIRNGSTVTELAARAEAESPMTEAQARSWARTELVAAANAGAAAAWELGDGRAKRWITMHDSRVRDTHRYMDGQTVPIDGLFRLSGWEVPAPGHWSLPPEERVNCRCTIGLLRGRRVDRVMDATTAQLRGVARDLGIKGTRGMRKADLQAAILAQKCRWQLTRSFKTTERLSTIVAAAAKGADDCANRVDQLGRVEALVRARAAGITNRHLSSTARLRERVATATADLDDDVSRAGRGFAPLDVLHAAQERARAKVRAVPPPSPADVAKGRQAAAQRAAGGRPGGDRRGSAESRRRRSENLYREFGGGDVGYVACVHCGKKLHYSADPALNPNGYEKLEQDKILTGPQGGTYRLANLLPSCRACNLARSAAHHGFGHPEWGDPDEWVAGVVASLTASAAGADPTVGFGDALSTSLAEQAAVDAAPPSPGAEFAAGGGNPWHDEVGRFAPKGTGRYWADATYQGTVRGPEAIAAAILAFDPGVDWPLRGDTVDTPFSPNGKAVMDEVGFGYFLSADDGNKVVFDAVLGSILADRGFDGPPELVRDVDTDTHTVLYRGLRGSRELADQFVEGPLFPGTGMNGSGTYTTPHKGEANDYGVPEGSLLTVGLPKDAKVIPVEEVLNGQMLAFDRLESMPAGLQRDRVEMILRDPGRVAAVLGYDAIAAGTYRVLLNRSILQVQPPESVYDSWTPVDTVVDGVAVFANPWHDERGRFAPKGTGRAFAVRGMTARQLGDHLDRLVADGTLPAAQAGELWDRLRRDGLSPKGDPWEGTATRHLAQRRAEAVAAQAAAIALLHDGSGSGVVGDMPTRRSYELTDAITQAGEATVRYALTRMSPGERLRLAQACETVNDIASSWRTSAGTRWLEPRRMAEAADEVTAAVRPLHRELDKAFRDMVPGFGDGTIHAKTPERKIKYRDSPDGPIRVELARPSLNEMDVQERVMAMAEVMPREWTAAVDGVTVTHLSGPSGTTGGWYNPRDHEIVVTAHGDRDTGIGGREGVIRHEVMHPVEQQVPGVLDASKAFLASRTATAGGIVHHDPDSEQRHTVVADAAPVVARSYGGTFYTDPGFNTIADAWATETWTTSFDQLPNLLTASLTANGPQRAQAWWAVGVLVSAGR